MLLPFILAAMLLPFILAEMPLPFDIYTHTQSIIHFQYSDNFPIHISKTRTRSGEL
jgi:hypothetical protein